jgi:hypothetical protein
LLIGNTSFLLPILGNTHLPTPHSQAARFKPRLRSPYDHPLTPPSHPETSSPSTPQQP